MPRLRRSSPLQPGWTRRRAGRGFVYLDAGGSRLDGAAVARIRALAIPPAWSAVWICPWPNGHLQAVGTDQAGRRQYLYHPAWRRARDRLKHERALDLAERLPAAREVVAAHLALPRMPRERALATAFRLIDLGCFRVGGEQYAQANGTFGVATLRRDHVRLRRRQVLVDFVGKGGAEWTAALDDAAVYGSVRALLASRNVGPELLAWRDGRRWHDVTSADVNAYVQEVAGPGITAKDFRTWHGTVAAAHALAVRNEVRGVTARRRAVTAAMRDVADLLGNTPAVARASYVDPRLVDLFLDDHQTIDLPDLPDLPIEAAAGRAAAPSADGTLASLHGDPAGEARVLRLLRP
jgi:DNA topoisomerase IB